MFKDWGSSQCERCDSNCDYFSFAASCEFVTTGYNDITVQLVRTRPVAHVQKHRNLLVKLSGGVQFHPSWRRRCQNGKANVKRICHLPGFPPRSLKPHTLWQELVRFKLIWARLPLQGRWRRLAQRRGGQSAAIRRCLVNREYLSGGERYRWMCSRCIDTSSEKHFNWIFNCAGASWATCQLVGPL